jgi:hypothetical protein
VEDQHNSIEHLVERGLIDSSMANFIINDKEEGILMGSFLEIAVDATSKAHEAAKKTQIAVLVEEDNCLYELRLDGTKRYIKALQKQLNNFPDRFKLV